MNHAHGSFLSSQHIYSILYTYLGSCLIPLQENIRKPQIELCIKNACGVSEPRVFCGLHTLASSSIAKTTQVKPNNSCSGEKTLNVSEALGAQGSHLVVSFSSSNMFFSNHRPISSDPEESRYSWQGARAASSTHTFVGDPGSW